MTATTRRTRFQTGPIRIHQNLIAMPALAAALCAVAAGPVLASPEFYRPPVHAKPHHQAPRIDHKPAHQSALAAIRAQARQNAALKGGNDGDRKAELDERKDELEERLEEITEEFLDSDEGEDARSRIDEEEERRRADLRRLQEEYIRRDTSTDQNCCGLGEKDAVAEWYLDEQERTNDAHDEAVDDILEDEMAAHDPDALDEYRKTKAELETVNEERREIREAQDRRRREARQGGQTPPGPGVIQP